MRKMHALSRMALKKIPALAAVLLIPLAASAVPAGPTVATNMCNHASNKPLQLLAELNAQFLALNFTGLPPDQCEKFVKDFVKSCIQIVTNGTQCTLNIDATLAKMSEIDCDAQADKADRDSCKQSVKQNLKNDQATASQTVQLIGDNTCNRSFALNLAETCLEGATPP